MASLLLWLSWLLLSLFCLYLLGLFSDARRGLPPGPRPLPVIGSLLKLGDQPHRTLAGLAKRHGPLMSLRLGTVTTVVVSSPDVAREVLQKHDAVLAARSVPDSVPREHSDSSVVWLPHTRQWRTLRKFMATELMAPERLDALQCLRGEKIQQLVAHVSRLASEGAAVDIGLVAFTTSLNLVSRTVFSVDLADLNDRSKSKEFQELVTEIMEAVGAPNVSDFFPALAAADLQGMRRRQARLFARLHVLFDEQIDRRLRGREVGEPAKNDFLDMLLDADVLDRQTLQSFFTDLFFAGSDTSSNTVQWAMAELLQNPSIMEKARYEIAKVIGPREFQESDINLLPYLQAVIKETLRLHPPAPFLVPRQAMMNVHTSGYMIPKGARVLVNVWAMGRDSDIWPEPEKFMPERFLEKKIDFKGRDFEFIPFGAGRRICPGMPLAMRMVPLMLASLLKQFGWTLPMEVEKDGVDMAEKFGLALAKAVPLCAIATRL